ncbi:hypothetical protein CGRA01v4_05074 [Colletotrichum graminicola]|nr:hypothetical protein CGRA01v4_05074 [Colletotrichum graminicola]
MPPWKQACVWNGGAVYCRFAFPPLHAYDLAAQSHTFLPFPPAIVRCGVLCSHLVDCAEQTFCAAQLQL